MRYYRKDACVSWVRNLFHNSWLLGMGIFFFRCGLGFFFFLFGRGRKLLLSAVLLAVEAALVDSTAAEATDEAPAPLVGSDLSFLTFLLGGRCCGLAPSSFFKSYFLEELASPDCGEIRTIR